MFTYIVITLLLIYSASISFVYYKKTSVKIDYERMYHDCQQKLSWHIEALEQKQIQCDKIESIAENFRKENAKLNKELDALKKGMLDLPKLLGKNLGK
jgi:peptidoglycan hydrolase CwlO-like protein